MKKTSLILSLVCAVCGYLSAIANLLKGRNLMAFLHALLGIIWLFIAKIEIDEDKEKND